MESVLIFMDAKDEAIIKILEKSAKLSSRALAKKVGLPISTVHRRIKRMEKRGVIKGYKAIIDYEKTREPIGVLVLINLAEAIPEKGRVPRAEVIEELKKFKEIKEILSVEAANFNLVVKVRLANLKELSHFVEQVRSILGIEEASSAIVIEEIIP
jgi:Lrp/AsnC family leucine-responsive transcriptional regulator